MDFYGDASQKHQSRMDQVEYTRKRFGKGSNDSLPVNDDKETSLKRL